MAQGQIVQQGLPVAALALDQPLGPLRPVADEIRARIGDKLVDHRLGIGRHPVYGGIGELGQRQIGGLQPFALAPPFLGDGLGESEARENQRGLGRGHQRAAIEGKRESRLRPGRTLTSL